MTIKLQRVLDEGRALMEAARKGKLTRIRGNLCTGPGGFQACNKTAAVGRAKPPGAKQPAAKPSGVAAKVKAAIELRPNFQIDGKTGLYTAATIDHVITREFNMPAAVMRGRDSLDFHEVSVANAGDTLRMAYRDAGGPKKYEKQTIDWALTGRLGGLGYESTVTRNNDSLDFKALSPDGVRRALEYVQSEATSLPGNKSPLRAMAKKTAGAKTKPRKR